MSLVSGKRVHILIGQSVFLPVPRKGMKDAYSSGKERFLYRICPNFFPRTGPQQLKDVPLDEDLFHFMNSIL